MNATLTLDHLIQAVDEACSAEAMLAAVEALADARLEAAIPKLIAILGYNNPGAAVAAVDGLIALGEPAVLPLLDLLDNYNYGARAWAIRALAGLGDPRGLEVLLEAASNDFALSVRRGAARGLGSLQWEKLSAEEQVPSQLRCLDVLWQALQDPEWVVRYAAVAGVQNLGTALRVSQPTLLPSVLEQVAHNLAQESVLAVRARLLLAQNHLNHLI
ncbi:MAG: HEAT repeat domain-containing protein [Thermosynechococcaceae cyanobacterium]